MPAAEDDAPPPGSDGFYNDTSIAARMNGATTIDALEAVVDVERFAGYIAGSVMCANWDGFGQNHFLAFSPTGCITVLPWDLDHTWGYVAISVCIGRHGHSTIFRDVMSFWLDSL